MNLMDIEFPNLGIYLENVPKSFSIGGFSIALYGIMIAVAMLCGLTLAADQAKRSGMDPELIWDLSIWLMVFSILGARIYYVIFMWDMYKTDLLQVFNLRGGGLAIYGGVIAGVLTVIVFCRRRKIPSVRVLDACVPGLTLGQIIGRWGNFFNREVFGGYTEGLFAMRIPAAMVRESDITEELAVHMTDGCIQVHPTFLYEGMWNACLLVFLLLFRKHKKFDGQLFLIYLAGYGLGRAMIEMIRTDQLYIPGTHVPVNMVLGLSLFAGSTLVHLLILSKRKKKAA